MKIYNKLVRDNIPEIILATGMTPTVHCADDTEYWEKLREKLQEEVNEFLTESNETEELADILEVIDAICEHKGVDRVTLQETQKRKRETRGGFKKRIILEQTT